MVTSNPTWSPRSELMQSSSLLRGLGGGPVQKQLLLPEDVVHRRLAGGVVRRLEVHRELPLNALFAHLLRLIEQADEVEHERRGEHGVLAEEVDLHLLRHAAEADDVDVV